MSPDEQSHAAKLGIKEKHGYIAQRLMRRYMIAAFVGCMPSEVRYDYQGLRPRLLGRHDQFFSVSHSRDAFAIALSHIGDCGIDFEVWRLVRYKQGIAERFF